VCPVMGRETAAGSLSRYGGASGLKGPRFESRCGKRQILTIGKRGKLWGEFLTMPMLMMMITMPPVHDAAVIVVAL